MRQHSLDALEGSRLNKPPVLTLASSLSAEAPLSLALGRDFDQLAAPLPLQRNHSCQPQSFRARGIPKEAGHSLSESRVPIHPCVDVSNMRPAVGSAKIEGTQVRGDGPTSSSGDPSRPMQPRTINVVLFSDAFVRKSSVINLIARAEVAAVSSDGNGCAMQFTRYDVSLDGMNFAIFDTIGLGEPQMGVNGYLKAMEKAYELILKLTDAGGIHLLLFCVLGGRITATTQSNYRLFFECLCGTKVPIALAFTSLGEKAKIEDWWTRNKTYMEHYGIRNDGHVCLRAVQDDPFGDDLAESQKNILELIKTCALKDQAFSPEPHSWLAKFGKASQSFIRKLKNPRGRDVVRALMYRCQVNLQIARKIVAIMDRGHMPSTVNVILFGEVGVGKSAVINLIAQREVTQVSSDADGCTMQSTRHDISFDGMNFAIFDTIGLVQPQVEVGGYLNAIANAYKLIAELSAAGGIHLLLFCMRGGRILLTTRNNYQLFYEYLCSKRVPVALVFTGLERETKLEDWWMRNKTDVEGLGIKGVGHACITTVQDDTLEEDLKYTESQGKIRELLKTCALSEAFIPEPDISLSGFGRLMKSRTRQPMPGKESVMRVLTRRCGVDPKTAKKIVDMMEKNDGSMGNGGQGSENVVRNEGTTAGETSATQQDNIKDGHRNDRPEGEGDGQPVARREGQHGPINMISGVGDEDDDDGDLAAVHAPEGSG